MPVQVVLLAGQSNMAGAGNYQTLSHTDKQRVKQAAKRVKINIGGQLKPLTYVGSKSKQKKYGFTDFFGPELFIGVTLAEANPNQEYV